ncbi:hypothetical protein L0222_24715 [bacterium]|nr:hypothetical protein [bacterium]MCI0605371.1 hypothetical protein [bacterium]
MPKTKPAKTNAVFPYVASLALLAAYSFLCLLVYADSLLAVNKPGRMFGTGLHSGEYCADAAYRLQFRSHIPSEVHHLYSTALVRSPADYNIFLDYFIHLRYLECCKDQTGKLMRGALERNPSSVRLYVRAVNYFLQTGNQTEALLYFQEAVKMQPETLHQLFAIAGERVSVEEIIRVTPRTTETLPILAQVLARKGPETKHEWLRTIQELHSKEVEPSLNMKTAEQAMKFGELELAKQYAEAALRHPETEGQARKMLAKIELNQSRQKKPKQVRRN